MNIQNALHIKPRLRTCGCGPMACVDGLCECEGGGIKRQAHGAFAAYEDWLFWLRLKLQQDRIRDERQANATANRRGMNHV